MLPSDRTSQLSHLSPVLTFFNVAARTDNDAKVIYPDYRRSVTVKSSSDEDAKVVYPDY